MAVILSREVVDGVSVIVAEGSSGDVAIAIDYTDILNDIKANVAIVSAQQTTIAAKVSSIENMANGDHGIHFRQPHQWEGGRARYTTESDIGDNENTITMTNVSE